VVELLVAAAPAPGGGARGGQRAVVDAHGLALGVGPGVVPVRDPHRPAAGWRLPRGGQVAAQADQHPAAGGPVRTRGGPVGAERLGGRAEVQPHAPGHADAPSAAVEVDLPPPGHGGHPHQRRAGRRDSGEIAVVAEHPDRLADRGVDVALREARGPQGDLERLEQDAADRDCAPAGVVDHGQLGVLAEAAARPVDLGHLRGHRQAGGPEAVPVGRQDHGAAAQRREARASGPVHQEPPEVTLPDPPDADGELDGAWRAEPSSLEVEPESLESELLVWPDAPVVAVPPVWPVLPEKPRAAIAENPAVSASAPASSQRVSRDTRRRPASRCAAVPGSEGMEAPLARETGHRALSATRSRASRA
jgi:hypothetical protein